MIASSDIRALLASTTGTTFANVVTDTEVKTSAANKHRNVRKHTVANVQLFNNTRDFDVYRRQVERSADTDNFVVSDTYYKHTDCFSLVEHKTNATEYLYCIFNNARSTFTIDDVAATRDDVAELLTNSEREKLLNTSSEVYNKTNDVTHNIHVRVIKLENVVSITANKQTITR